MLFKSLTRKLLGKTRAKEYVMVRDGKVVRQTDPLPGFFPELYKTAPHDKFANRENLLNDAEEFIAGLTRDCHLRQKKLPALLMHNIEILLDIPAVYQTQLFLRGKKLQRLYTNNFATTALFQACVFFTRSEISDHLHDMMMLGSLGILMRYYGVSFLKPEEREVLLQSRRYNAFDPRQRLIRDQFLDRYRQVADNMCRLSADRFSLLVGKEHTCPPSQMLAMAHVIRYSPRLMGRAAEILKPREVERMQELAGYIAMISNFASAWAVGDGKKPGVILAEEWGRSKAASKFKDIHTTCAYNLHALEDLFRICRCKMLTNFQGSHRDAVYSTLDNILVKEVALEIDDTVKEQIEAERDSRKDRDKKRLSSTRWQCFKPKERLDHRATTIRDAIAGKVRFGGEDPSDTSLLPVDETVADEPIDK